MGEKGEGVVFSRPLKGPLSPLYTVVGPVNLQSAVRAPMRRERGELEGRVHLVEGYERRAWVVPQVAAGHRVGRSQRAVRSHVRPDRSSIGGVWKVSVRGPPNKRVWARLQPRA